MFKPSLNTSGAIVVRTEHRFADTSARDTYFASHADELVNLLYIWIEDTSTLQQYYTSTASFISVHPVVGIKGDDGADGTDGHSITVSVQASEPATKAVGDIWVDTDDSLFNTADDSVLWNGIARPTLAGNANKALAVNSAGNAFEFATVAIDGTYASKTESDLTLYVYEDATGDADGSSKANGFTTLQAAIDAIPDVAQNVTIIVCKGSTNYLGQTTTIQKASVKSLTIQGEFYAYDACDANAVAGKIVDASADFSDFEVGDRVVCTKYSWTVGASSIEDYFYATITEVGEGYIQTSEETKVPTTGWKYLINQTVFDGDSYTTSITGSLISANGICFTKFNKCFGAGLNGKIVVNSCICYDNRSAITSYTLSKIYLLQSAVISIPSGYYGMYADYGPSVYAKNAVFAGSSASSNLGIKLRYGINTAYSLYCGFFNLDKCVALFESTANIQLTSCYIDSTCTYGAYGYNITLSNCTNNATTPVYNLTSGGRVEEAEFAASASQNLIINGDFSVAQRGTSFTSETWRTNADDSYLLDRWLLLSDGNDIVDVTQISGAFSRSRYALQAEVETANKKFGFCQIIEANMCIPLRGQKISISFAAKTVPDKLIENVRIAVLEWTGTADTVTSDVVSAWNAEGMNPTWATNWTALNTPANLALTTSEQTFKVENLTVGASCNNLAVFVWVDDTDAAVDDILQLGEVQVVRGSVAPEFTSHKINDELLMCGRYGRPLCATQYDRFGAAVAISTTAAKFFVGINPPMRTTPTIITPNVAKLALNGVADVSFSSWAIDAGASSAYSLHMNITVESGLTEGQMYNTSSTDTAPVFLECEL